MPQDTHTKVLLRGHSYGVSPRVHNSGILLSAGCCDGVAAAPRTVTKLQMVTLVNMTFVDKQFCLQYQSCSNPLYQVKQNIASLFQVVRCSKQKPAT